MRAYMQNVRELNYSVEQETQAIEPLFDEPPEDEESLSRPARMFASVGAWLVERFAHVTGPAFIEDGRLAAYSRELWSPACHQPTTGEKIIH